jgi:hypothetical protein
VQILPQAPQFEVSLLVSTQAAPQVVLVPQAEVQAPFSHTCSVLQSLPHAPQFFGSDFWLTHVPEQLE